MSIDEIQVIGVKEFMLSASSASFLQNPIFDEEFTNSQSSDKQLLSVINLRQVKASDVISLMLAFDD